MNISEGYKKRISKLAGVPITNENNAQDVLGEISMEEIEIPKEYVHDELNPAIWDNGELDQEVREKLLNIAMEFYKELDIDAEIRDIKMPGSMANYNWSEHSDIDVHLFFTLSDISENEELVLDYLDAKIQIWREKHKDIKIRGYEVELYAQDERDDYYMGGVYSLLNNKWERKPSKEKVVLDKHALKVKIKRLADKIEELERSQAYETPENTHETSTRLKEKIKKMRQSGLDEGGEFSIENLAFKYLRNSGHIKRLLDIRDSAYNKKLSLD